MFSLRRYLSSEMWSEAWPASRPQTAGWAYARDATLAWWGLTALATLFEEVHKSRPEAELENLGTIYRHLSELVASVHAATEERSALWKPTRLVRQRERLDPELGTREVYGWILEETTDESEFADLAETYGRYTMAIGTSLWLAHATATMHMDEPPVGQFWYHVKELFLGIHEKPEGG